MAEDIKVDESVVHYKSVGEQLAEASQSHGLDGLSLNGSARTDSEHQMSSIQSLIGQSPEGSTVLNEDSSVFFHDMYIAHMVEGNHQESAPKLAAWRNQNGAEFKQQTGMELDEAHMRFTMNANGLGQGMGVVVNSSTLREIAESGRSQALAERGIAPHLRGPIDHETDQYRAPHKHAAYEVALVKGETVNPRPAKQCFRYAQAG